ncbi:MAG: PaaX family transcriptional regulator [Streptosporangiales bacterium]
MRPRSVILDLFGDYIRYHGGRIRLRALAALASDFGVSPGTTRVVAARMRREGWLSAHRVGRETMYGLTPAALRMLDEGRERIFTRLRDPWDGQWSMVIYSVPETDRPARERLRKTLAWLGFGPLAPSTWICPHNRLSEVAEALADLDGVRLDLLTVRSSGPPADRALAMRCWALTALNEDYQSFVRRYRHRLGDWRRRRLSGAEALVERVALVSEYRKFPFRDPDLPVELLPAGWVGHDAHEIFLEAHKLLLDPAEAHYLDIVQPSGRNE